MSDNMTLWKSVEKTDPIHTKQITGKPYKGNSPKPHYLIMRATETFGPCGVGWGFEIVSQQFVPGSPGDIVHVAHIRLWYEFAGKRGAVEHVGQTMFAGKNKNGPYTDEDAPKKSVTDGLVKALSMIGFAGDIFLGRYDDSKYVADVGHEFREAAEAAEPLASDVLAAAEKALANSAMKGTEALKTAWTRLSPVTRELFGGKAPDRLKALAAQHDKEAA